MKNHFGGRSNVSLATPGVEGVDDERRYKAVKNQKWWDEKLAAIREGEELFGEVFCSRKEAEKKLVCLDRSCVKCGDEEVKRNADLKEACHPEKAIARKTGGGSSGAQGGGQQSSELTAAVVVGLLLSTRFGNFRC
jgi:hypothetical protein